MPWSALSALIEPVYPKAGNGPPPIGLERTLRIYFQQSWFNIWQKPESGESQNNYLAKARTTKES